MVGFETTDPALRGEMTITFRDAHGVVVRAHIGAAGYRVSLLRSADVAFLEEM